MFKKMVCALFLCVAVAPQMHAQKEVSYADVVKAKAVSATKWSAKTALYGGLSLYSMCLMCGIMGLSDMLNWNDKRSDFLKFISGNPQYKDLFMDGYGRITSEGIPFGLMAKNDYAYNFAARAALAAVIGLPILYYGYMGLKKQCDELVYAIDGAFVENDTAQVSA